MNIRTLFILSEDDWKVVECASKPALIGKNFLDLVAPAMQPQVQRCLEDVLDSGDDEECLAEVNLGRKTKKVRITIENLYPRGLHVAIEDGASLDVVMPPDSISMRELADSIK